MHPSNINQEEKNMKMRVLYTCQYCYTDYADMELAKACEENHKSIKESNIVEIYRSKASVPDGFPIKILIKNEQGHNVSYRRE